MILLSGDAIVNESMLTGESVPVGKMSIKDVDLAKWKEVTTITPEISKSFLYAGTRIIRVRGAMTADGGTGGPALALVVRTGEQNQEACVTTWPLIIDPQDSTLPRDHWLGLCYSQSRLVLHFIEIPCASSEFWLV